MFLKVFARQLRHPSGLIGRYVARWMNRSNVGINHAALALCDGNAGKNCLEIGFGGGALLEMMLKENTFPKLHGIDASKTMVSQTSRKLRKPIRQGRLELRHGDIAALPYADNSFDAIVSLNTIYFWPSLEAGIRECSRVLSEKGELVLGFDDKTEMSQWPGHQYGFSMYEVEEVQEALGAAGFRNIEASSGQTTGWGLFHCLKARRS